MQNLQNNLSSIAIPIGVRSIMELENGENYFTTIRGAHVKKYLLFDMPIKDGKPLPLKSRLGCIFRFVHEGTVLGFATSILESVYHPVPVLFVRYPQTVERKNLRNEQRYKMTIPCTFVCDEKQFEGTITDLSQHGCAVTSSKQLEEKSVIQLSFTLPNQDNVPGHKAEIRSVTPYKDKFLLGLYFPYENSQIKDFISLISATEL